MKDIPQLRFKQDSKWLEAHFRGLDVPSPARATLGTPSL